MAYKVVVPRLGLTMEEGRIVEWYKEDGETVEAGELLFAVETDKAVLDVEAPASGIVYHVPDLSPNLLPIGFVIGYILAPGEEVPLPQVAVTAVAAATPAEAAVSTSAAASVQTASAGGRKLASPAARRRAKELGIDWRTIEHPGSGPITVAYVEEAARSREQVVRVQASPVARRLAERAGIDLAELAVQKGKRQSGERIKREDVEAAIAAREAAAAPPPPAPVVGEAVPVTHIRRIIAQRMLESAHTTAPLTLTTEADVTELVALRERIKATLGPRGQVGPTYTDLIIRLTGLALQEHPMLNAYWKEDEIIAPTGIHIAVAVDTESGLLVPVVRDVLSKSVQQIAEEVRALAEKARSRQLGPDDLQGGTFTVTNLGMYGVDAFTSIINLPQCAILGVGRIISKPAAYNDEVTLRQMMALSLTFDHRVVDGGPAARFLKTIREYVEQPCLWLVR